MKRCIRWLNNWFGKMTWQEKVGYILGGLLGIVTVIIVFVLYDKVPATPMDFKN